ncbi:hypothetical protein BD410DRAFT_896162 [Rickenella mellea]|uniref:DUF4145 domain-containing protein n=1 Tax=Rickenella mellea TaxID=50990 RepID=A0A4Y7QCZ5_9AGAM|nr:hypothetical protein BD410DRAFT_896162 [Rickenella mellea]
MISEFSAAFFLVLHLLLVLSQLNATHGEATDSEREVRGEDKATQTPPTTRTEAGAREVTTEKEITPSGDPAATTLVHARYCEPRLQIIVPVQGAKDDREVKLIARDALGKHLGNDVSPLRFVEERRTISGDAFDRDFNYYINPPPNVSSEAMPAKTSGKGRRNTLVESKEAAIRVAKDKFDNLALDLDRRDRELEKKFSAQNEELKKKFTAENDELKKKFTAENDELKKKFTAENEELKEDLKDAQLRIAVLEAISGLSIKGTANTSSNYQPEEHDRLRALHIRILFEEACKKAAKMVGWKKWEDVETMAVGYRAQIEVFRRAVGALSASPKKDQLLELLGNDSAMEMIANKAHPYRQLGNVVAHNAPREALSEVVTETQHNESDQMIFRMFFNLVFGISLVGQ